MITPGTSIGSFEVVSLLGSGGMGEVYRARDSRLKRDVALKILPDTFADSPERLVRFQREAEVLASLNHPHVAAIYGLEESNGRRALVLELVDGETLADRIARGPLPLDEALTIASEIAEALEYAHDHGVIHRDLKPSNVKITPDGVVKVLDFGLARLSEHAPMSASDATASPTLTQMSRVGVLLGTAAYMSPEQVRGKTADKRSDTWAFGCVVYEMLTGRRAVEGSEVSDILANVLKSPVDWSRLPAHTPPSIRRLLRRCLEKDRAQRLPDMASARLEIADAVRREDETPSTKELTRRRWIPWSMAAAGVLAAAVAVGLWAPWRTAPAAAPIRMTVAVGADVTLSSDLGSANTVLSPDGQTLAFVAAPPRGQLYVRRMDQLRATPLAGTEDAISPVFSPDGQWIAFHSGGKLKKISVTGGAPITLADATPLGFAWTARDTIVYQPGGPNPPRPGTPVGGLFEVPANGGEPVAVTPPGDTFAIWPQVLPGTDAIVFTSASAPGPTAINQSTIVVQRIPNGERKVVRRGGYYARYANSGHLLYVSNGTIFAAPFDTTSLTVTGNAVPVIEQVSWNTIGGGSEYDVSRNGTLAFTPGTGPSNFGEFSWVARTGAVTTLKAFSGIWGMPRFSPDGRRLAMVRSEEGNLDVWTYDIERDTPTRITVDSASDLGPVWTRDGRRIAFGSARGQEGVSNLYWQRADGTGEAQRLTQSKDPQLPSSWHPTRPLLAFHEGQPTGAQRVMILELEGNEATGWKPKPPTEFVGGPFRNVIPMFSPDGRWLAYLSNKSGGVFELYVRPFPGPGEEVQISSGGANDPRWSPTTREIVYSTIGQTSNPSGQLMVASYSVNGNTFTPERPRLWSTRSITTPPINSYASYIDLHPDGQRVAASATPDTRGGKPQDSEATVVLILNFFEELRRRTAVAR